MGQVEDIWIHTKRERVLKKVLKYKIKYNKFIKNLRKLEK